MSCRHITKTGEIFEMREESFMADDRNHLLPLPRRPLSGCQRRAAIWPGHFDPINASDGFMEASMSEDIFAGPAVLIRGASMFCNALPRSPTGRVGVAYENLDLIQRTLLGVTSTAAEL
ncbi:hypothetical protein BKA67DRAFT_647840 [Truncatella angustata]|uniref:Uncharacterized protein n=1 Tax=Truncatella angustata TaxID=152316 RepID=A0A9P8ZVE4_9PEZI|nr:uncharacterized protein BKA67DRAFT_647840 [Truncatella angustata]KAH6651886.1 hypothetical protein BKA67DRAFT_647840 [Truncatella angustata]